MPLHLNVSPGSGEAPYRQLVRQLRKALASRSLKTGERLPAVRVLARELRVSPNTVARAYRELERDGLLAARAGGGTRVMGTPPLAAQARREPAWQLRERLRPVAEKLVAEGRLLGLSSTEIRRLVNTALGEHRGQ